MIDIKKELKKILIEYVEYEETLWQEYKDSGAPIPIKDQHNFSFARFYNWIFNLKQP